MSKSKSILVLLAVYLFSVATPAHAGTILSLYKYAWSNNVGYLNFENVIVSNTGLSGYAWSANAGWIKFNPALGGVSNDGTGNLSGYAWGDSLGWINFDNVLINPTTGKFSGTATGSLIGTINFDCAYCDVKTDWRQASSSGGGYITIPISLSSQANVIDTLPMVALPDQSASLAQDTSVGKIAIDIPTKTISQKTIFTVINEPLIGDNAYLIVGDMKLVNTVFFNISAKDEKGNNVRTFSKPITITLPIPSDFSGEKNMSVYWLNEVNWQWVLIPDAVFTENKVTFAMNHLTKFAIFTTKDQTIKVKKALAPSIALPIEKKPEQDNTSVDKDRKIEEIDIKNIEKIDEIFDLNLKNKILPILLFLFSMLLLLKRVIGR